MFKGSYKTRDSSGSPLNYFKGDSVIFHGKMYEVIRPTRLSPLETPENWMYKGLTEIYSSENPPLNPQVGQIWNNKQGRYYSYYYDGNNYSWVEF